MNIQLGMDIEIERGTGNFTNFLFRVAFIQTPKFELKDRSEFVGFVQRLVRRIGTNVVIHEYSNDVTCAIKFDIDDAYTIKIRILEYFSGRAEIAEELTEEESAAELKDFIRSAIEYHQEAIRTRWTVSSSDLAEDLKSIFGIK